MVACSDFTHAFPGLQNAGLVVACMYYSIIQALFYASQMSILQPQYRKLGRTFVQRAAVLSPHCQSETESNQTKPNRRAIKDLSTQVINPFEIYKLEMIT